MYNCVNLTLPLYSYMSVGNLWAYDVPFQVEPIRKYETGGAQLEHFQFHSETGTKLVLPSKFDEKSPKIGELDFSQLVDRETVVIDIPKCATEKITGDDIENIVANDSAYQNGMALLIRTGWGDGNKYQIMGEKYVLDGPIFSAGGAARLYKLMQIKKTNLLAIDTPCLGGNGAAYMKREWCSLQPWLRPHWPSDQATTYLRHYTPEKVMADWGVDYQLLKAGMVLQAICNAGKITTKIVRLTILPFFAEKSPSAPATVIAKLPNN